MMQNYLAIVLKNIACEPGTFIYQLHEESRFDPNLFQAYYAGLRGISAADTDMATLLKIISTNTFILRCLIYHFLPEDLYVIKNLPSDISDYVQKIDVANHHLMQSISDGLS